MELRQIRTFVTVAQLGTVSRAASRLHVAQPALSRQIAALEDQLRLKLFDRLGRRLVLTAEGEQLLNDCRGVLNSAEALSEHAEVLLKGDVGVLRVSASPHLIEGIFPTMLSEYAERYPKVQVRVIDSVGEESFSMLERGELHLVQTTGRAVAHDEQRFASRPLAPMEIHAAYHPRFKLGRGGEVEIDRLALYPLLQATSDFVMRKGFDAACRVAGFTPNYVLECRAPHALLAMAEAGHGVAIIPSALRVQRYVLRRARVTYRGHPLDEPLAILWNKRRRLPQYGQVFCELFAERLHQAFPLGRRVGRA